MKTTISKLNTIAVEPGNSESSSEYTTPAQSQTTSPTREESPPTFGVPSDPAIRGLVLALGLTSDQVGGGAYLYLYCVNAVLHVPAKLPVGSSV